MSLAFVKGIHRSPVDSPHKGPVTRKISPVDDVIMNSHNTPQVYTCGCLSWALLRKHDDVIKWKHFPRNWPFVRGIHRSPVNSPHKDQWRGALMFSLICVWINDWVINREAGDLRRYRAHYDVIVMLIKKGHTVPYMFHLIPTLACIMIISLKFYILVPFIAPIRTLSIGVIAIIDYAHMDILYMEVWR